MNVFNKVKHLSDGENKCAQQSPMKTVTLIMPLEATTVNNPINSSGVTAGAISGVTSGALIK